MTTHELLIEYAKRFNLRVFIETGTFEGDTIKAMFKADLFKQIHTIDINLDYAEAMARRFARMPSIHCWKGPSDERLACILQSIHEPTLFWLDAHMPIAFVRKAKGVVKSPLAGELNAILAHIQDHVILIDDAAYYEKLGKKYDYLRPKEIEQIVTEHGMVFENEDNIIRCYKESKV